MYSYIYKYQPRFFRETNIYISKCDHRESFKSLFNDHLVSFVVG